MLYQLSFVLLLSAIAAIMTDRKKLAFLQPLFIPAAALWLLTMGLEQGLSTKLFGTAFRDLIFLLGATLVFRTIANFGTKVVPLSLGLISLFSFFHWRTNTMNSLTPQASEAVVDLKQIDELAAISVDESAELLVELDDNDKFERWKRWIGAQGWTTKRAFYPSDEAATELDDYYVVDIPDGEKWEDALYKLQHLPEVIWAEPNEIFNQELLPARTTPGLRQQLGINDPGVDDQWAMDALKVQALYQLLMSNKVKPQKRALVAILDTGVDAQHEDLKANFVSTKKKYDDDPRGHGTHCAGIAGAVTNNGRGVASLARTNDFFRITSVKVLRAGGSGTQRDIIAGMLEAVDAGADVLSMSLGGFSTQSRQRAYDEAVAYASKKNAIVVAAAGNSNRDAATYTPVNARGIIGVSAIDSELQRATFSNSVDKIALSVAAPGVGIYSTKPNNNYNSHNGTSMATPFVSGLIGIMKSIQPELTNKEVYKILHQTGVATKNTKLTGRLIQPAAAVEVLVGRSAEAIQ